MKTVLFICVGNASRSQMAEALFNSLTMKARAMSAGSRPAGKVDSLTIDVMKEIGIDISKNKPKPIANENVEKADKIISMCEGVCPVVGRPIVHWEVEETKGKGIETVRRVRDEIKDKVIGLIEGIG